MKLSAKITLGVVFVGVCLWLDTPEPIEESAAEMAAEDVMPDLAPISQDYSSPNTAPDYGYNDADKAFLAEHGVSEAEARAMETILENNGVN